MSAIHSIAFVLLAFTLTVCASPHKLHRSPAWLIQQGDRHVAQDGPATFSLAAHTDRQLFLPAGHWLELPNLDDNRLLVWQSYTLGSKRRVYKDELSCTPTRCQINAAADNRLISIENVTSDIMSLELREGQYLHHRSPYKQTVALPLDILTINKAHQYETFYHLKPHRTVSVTFQQAQKLKLSVKQLLTDSPHQTGKVYAFIDKQAVSVLPLSNAVADEYFSHPVSISHDDYIDVPAQSTLTLKSYGNALVQITRSNRPFLDTDSAQKQQESLLNPYWINSLTNQLDSIIVKQDVRPLTQIDYAKATPLAHKRHQQFVGMVTTRNFLTPKQSDVRTKTKHEHSLALQGVRFANKTIYPIQSILELEHHQLDKQLTFDLQHSVNATTQITLYVRAQQQTELTATLGKRSYTIAINHTGLFHRIELNHAHHAQQLVLDAGQTMLEVAVAIQELSPLIDSELLFMQPGKLVKKSPALYAKLTQHQQEVTQAYLDSLQPYSATQPDTLTLSYREQRHIIEQAPVQLHNSPQSLLPNLKRLVHSAYDDIVFEAWVLRIRVLDKLNYGLLAQRYLEGLIKHQSATVRQFAAKQLLARYQLASLEYKIQGLCTLFSEYLTQCSTLIPTLYETQSKRQFALWLSHDYREKLDHNSTLLADLNYLHLSKGSTNAAPLFSIYHHGQSPLHSVTGPYQAYTLKQDQRIRIVARQPLTLKIGARTQHQNPRQQRTAWLHLNLSDKAMMLPIFSDISSRTLDGSEHLMSVAATGYVQLQANERLDISASEMSYINISALHNNLLINQGINHITTDYQHLPFSQLLSSAQIGVKTQLTNTLKRLSNQNLTEAQFTALFARVDPTILTPDEMILFKRIAHFGQWQNVTQYKAFLGTQLILLDDLEQLSLAEQLTRHASKNTHLSGILLRPYHTLSLDVSQLEPSNSKVRIHFSGAELAGQQTAKVTIQAGERHYDYTLHDVSMTEHLLTTSDIANGVIRLRWHNPYQSQLLSVQTLEKQGKHWRNIDLAQKQRFYLTDEQQPLVIELAQDALVKIEYLSDNKRHHVERFYPSGKHTLAVENARLLRAFIWQMTNNNHKLPVSPNADTSSTWAKVAMSPATLQPFIQSNYAVTQDAVNITGYIKAEHQGESNFDDQLQQHQSHEWGVNFRYKANSNWYKLSIAKQHDDVYYNTYQLIGRTDWLAEKSDWYAQTQLQVNWQPQQKEFNNLLSGRLTLAVGQRWQVDETHVKQWWMQPYYFYSDAKSSDLALSNRVSPDILTSYKHNHPYGWRFGYQHGYQNRVDQRLSYRAQLSSNKDWYSLDNIRFNVFASQFYQGHILSAQLTARYAFSDEHRTQSQWQYLSSIGWQKWYAITPKLAVKIALDLEQNWRLDEHSVALQVTFGNVPSTGFGPFGYTEQSFQSLSFTQLMQQVNDE
ncbi:MULTISPECIES: hypothetical protein [Pseudoalteromonas]|uniref:Uncharacterized protein n=1 Tax=Pseudoalteromonas amylolytica TaxID=1859457 RepID=A0A1S1N0T5_9GAMM|nr:MULTISPECIES: hypothetical protein [Pseudoalteromonas]OHU89303.1 hypothetical protein BFC16_06645 [Pseudoalteromonas sp. JW3]OHU92203.1 hypothetical protein BET10_07750 [Pseudoalteromonas amylolytica]